MKTIIRNFLSVLRRYKLATVLNVLGLSVAFAAFMAIMMQVDYDRNFDRGHKDADRIFRVEAGIADRGFQAIVSRPFSDAFFRSSPHIAAGTIIISPRYRFFFSIERGGGKEFIEEEMLNVSPSYTQVFTFDMIEGSDRALDDPGKVLIPLSLSRRLFGNEPATGKLLTGRDENFTVGGVFRDFPRNSSVRNVIYSPMKEKENISNWGNWNYQCFIRVDAAENVDGLAENFFKVFEPPANNSAWYEDLQLRFTSLPDVHFIADVAYDGASKSNLQTVFILFTIAFVIVIIAGINYTNFSAALAPKRIRSINTQKVLGGSTVVIRTALIVEGIVICIGSYLLGVGLLTLAETTSLAQLVDADLSPATHPALVAATAALAFLTGLLAGLYPAFYVTSVPPAMTLKGSFGLSSKGRHLRNVLIGIQFIASFALIISASFMYLQNYYMQHAPLGYDRDELIVTNITAKINDSREAFSNQLKSFAGIGDVTYAAMLLSSQEQYMGWGRSYHDRDIHYQCLPVDHSFLEVMGIQVAEGRGFREDDKNTRHGVYVFNEKARSNYDLVLNDHIDSAEIVGFMSDVKFASFRTAVAPMAFFVWGTQNWGNTPNFAYVKVKAGADLRAAVTHVRNTLQTFDGEYPFNVRFFDEVLQRTYEKEQKLSSLITLFSLVAIFISIVGVFGLVIFDSEYRRKEIGIRKVFGSSTREILVVFNRTYIRILCLCFVLAAPAAWYAVDRWLENFAYRTPMYWWIYLAAFAVIFVLTVATVTFQNWRAANANPVESIKGE
ncbi:MAG: ABC transporter permease [Tannerella sp.]|jgi:putative ABC transport system permease protein|nr:ABC transporter permease [Tannerella sp.]